jgi:flagellar biosynthesis protein FlhF
MRIKKFVAATVKEASDQMRKELGEEAIVLNTRRVAKEGKLSFLGKELVEITAAIDDPVPAVRNTFLPTVDEDSYGRNPHPAGGRMTARKITQQAETTFDGVLSRTDDGGSYGGNLRPTGAGTRTHKAFPQEETAIESLRRIEEHFRKREPHSDAPLSPRSMPEDFANFHQLRGEVEDIKGTLKEIADHIKYNRMPSLPSLLKDVYATLIDQDVSERLAADLVQSVFTKLGEHQLRNRELIDKCLLEEMANIIKTSEPVKTRKRKTKIVALVGPTGVGKTTTIAKLAAINKLVYHLDVGLISADTYRIGAIEQLRTFANIADIPMEVVYRPSEMGGVLRKLRGKDVIFVDTVGRNQRVRKELSELARFIDAADPDEVHLVLSASTNATTLDDIVQRFRILKPNRFLFSKMDEAATLGSLLEVIRQYAVPVSYVTTGQTVPDDIIPAEAKKLASMIYAGAFANA